MKIELVKEHDPFGIFYSVERDGKFVTGTVKRDFNEAQSLYNKIVVDSISKKDNGKEIIKSILI